MKVHSYTHIGKKPNNEDALEHSAACLVVCDGVGGAIKGEKASKEIVNYMLNNLKPQELNELSIKDLTRNAQTYLNTLTTKNPPLEGMATTLAAVFLSSTGLFTAHAGDSRIFIIKPAKKKFWQTWDHSIVASLVQINEITREEARKHPMNNQISKAFIGNLDNKITEPEIHHLSDIEDGDICFICSDGVLETFSDYELLSLLSNDKMALGQKLELIKEKCKADSNDNHSAIIAEFEQKDIRFFFNYPSKWHLIDSIA